MPWTFVGDKIGDIYDNKLVTVEDKNSPYYGYPLLDEDGSWQSTPAVNSKNKIGNFNPDFIMPTAGVPLATCPQVRA